MLGDYDYGQARSFNLGVAQELGVEAALLYDELCFWAGKGHRDDGWIYKTYEDLIARLPFMSEKVMRKYITKLVDAGYIEKRIMKIFNGTAAMHFKILTTIGKLPNVSSGTDKREVPIESDKKSVPIYTPTNTATNKQTQTQASVASIGHKRRGNPEVQALLNYSKKLGFTGSQSQTEVYAAKRLMTKHGYAKVKDRLTVSQEIREQPYAIQIDSLVELESKWLKLDRYLQANGTEGVPPEVLKEIEEYVNGYAERNELSEKERLELIERKKNRYINEGGNWK